MELTQVDTIEQTPKVDSVNLRYVRNAALVKEFKVKPPTSTTYSEAIEFVQKGLPFVKSIKPEALEALLKNGQLASQAQREGEGFDVIYASVIHNKGYGPFTVILNPEVMRRGNYVAFAIDHASTYMTEQLRIRADKLVADGIAPNRAAIDYNKLEQELLDERYRLTPDQFAELYAYLLASYTDNPIQTHEDYKVREELQKFITFDIGLPEIKLKDVQELIYKENWGGKPVDIDAVSNSAQEAGKPIIIVPRIPGVMYEQEKRISRDLIDRIDVPEKFRSATESIA